MLVYRLSYEMLLWKLIFKSIMPFINVSLDSIYYGLNYIRWSLIVIFVDVVILTFFLLLAAFLSPLAAYLFSILVYYMVPLSVVFPYAVLVFLWMMGFRRLWLFNSKYFIGFLGSVILVISYFANVGYMAYVFINILIGEIPIAHFLLYNGLILYQSKILLVLSLYLPLPVFISVITGVVGVLLSMITLHSLSRDYGDRILRLGSIVTLVGVLFLINIPIVGGPLISVGLLLLIMGLGNVMDKVIQ